MDEITVRIKQILKSRLRINPSVVDQCAADTPLLGKGIGLDSVESLSLASAIEEEFHIVIEDNDLTANLFASLASLAAYVQEKTQAGLPPVQP